MKNKCIFLVVLAIFTSCSVKIKNFESYSSSGIGRAPLAPSPEQIKTNQVKVVLYNIEDKKAQSENSAVSNLSASLVRNLLRKTNVSILDRSAIEKFNDEAILAATETGEDPEFTAAQYAIKGQIDDYNSYSSYQAESYEEIPTERADGEIFIRRVFHPALCHYIGEVNGRFEVYALPSLELIMDITLKGKGFKSVEAPKSGISQFTGLIDNKLLAFGVWNIASSAFDSKCNDKNLGASSINLAVNESVSENESKKLLNQFAAKGYVNDVRKHNKKDKYIIQVTIGSKNGLAQNGTLNVYRQQNRTDALSGKNKIENQKITEARISQLVESNNAWLVVKEEEEAQKILIGDLVKVIY